MKFSVSYSELEESKAARELAVCIFICCHFDFSTCSTYSTLYNHPTKIVEPPRAGGKVKLSRKTGIPLGVIPGPLPKESVDKTGWVGVAGWLSM